jgi:hypothetical protein
VAQAHRPPHARDQLQGHCHYMWSHEPCYYGRGKRPRTRWARSVPDRFVPRRPVDAFDATHRDLRRR